MLHFTRFHVRWVKSSSKPTYATPPGSRFSPQVDHSNKVISDINFQRIALAILFALGVRLLYEGLK